MDSGTSSGPPHWDPAPSELPRQDPAPSGPPCQGAAPSGQPRRDPAQPEFCPRLCSGPLRTNSAPTLVLVSEVSLQDGCPGVDPAMRMPLRVGCWLPHEACLQRRASGSGCAESKSGLCPGNIPHPLGALRTKLTARMTAPRLQVTAGAPGALALFITPAVAMLVWISLAGTPYPDLGRDSRSHPSVRLPQWCPWCGGWAKP